METNASQAKSHKIALSVPLTRGGTFVFEASAAPTSRDVEKIKRLLEAIQDDREEEKRETDA